MTNVDYDLADGLAVTVCDCCCRWCVSTVVGSVVVMTSRTYSVVVRPGGDPCGSGAALWDFVGSSGAPPVLSAYGLRGYAGSNVTVSSASGMSVAHVHLCMMVCVALSARSSVGSGIRSTGCDLAYTGVSGAIYGSTVTSVSSGASCRELCVTVAVSAIPSSHGGTARGAPLGEEGTSRELYSLGVAVGSAVVTVRCESDLCLVWCKRSRETEVETVEESVWCECVEHEPLSFEYAFASRWCEDVVADLDTDDCCAALPC